MKERNRFITGKVVVGYLLLIAIAVYAVSYIYNIVEQVAVEDFSDNQNRTKIYLVTNTLSLLYESEALGQLIVMQQGEITHFNRTLNKARHNLDSLRTYITDSVQLHKIDTIELLLERKRWNARRLLDTWREANTDSLYIVNFERIMAVPDTVINELQVQERIEVKQDTVVVPRRKRGFFRRLAEAFVPAKEDTSIVVNSTFQVIKDTLVNAYNPTDTIVSVLRSIQDSVTWQRRRLMELLVERAANLRYSNSVITQEINQMLRDIEEEEVNASLARLYKKQTLVHAASRKIGLIAVSSVLVALLFLALISHDISRGQFYRKQLEKAKQIAESLLLSREKLILTISHDIRAPLSSIMGYIELLQRRRPDARQQYYLENMRSSSNHVLSLVNDLLDYQRLESGEIELHRLPFRVPVLFQEIGLSFRPLAEAKGLQLKWVLLPEEMEQVYLGDTIRLRQVVSNLLSNAIKFTDEGNVSLVVSIEPVESYQYILMVVVRDSGPGIPYEDRERIFGEFARVYGTDRVEGFGLGLSITRKLVQLMHGELTLDSVVGQGSSFKVCVPLPLAGNQFLSEDAPIAEEKEEDEIPMLDPALAGQEIACLLVDDDPLQLALTEELLKQSNVEVVCCANPRKVCEWLRSRSFAVVITDIQMPQMDGYQLLQLIRESGIEGADRIPVVALSANVGKEQEHYQEAGFTAFLNKPFTAAQLISLLNNLLKLRLKPGAGFDFSSLTAFAGEDGEASMGILRTFVEETRKSIAGLTEARAVADRVEAGRIAHKLIPLFAMLGANTLVQHLRLLEKQDPDLSSSTWLQLLDEVLAQAQLLVEEAESHTVKDDIS